MTQDPYMLHLRKADELFAQGEIVKAGQIWQAVLKQNASHAEARTGLMKVKQHLLALRETMAPVVPEPPLPPEPEAMPAPPAQEPEPAFVTPLEPSASTAIDARSTAPEAPAVLDPGRVITGALDPDRILAEGCTLYDMGQIADALKKWELLLNLDPDHALARGYANGARRELGLPSLQTPKAPVEVQADRLHEEDDLEKLLKEAVQLYDMGLVEEAISKWERVLALEPQRTEIAGYVRQARAELASSVPSPAAPPAHSAVREPEALDLKLRQAEHLLSLQRPEEAAFTFQQALSLDPGNARALQGLERCRKPSGQPAQRAERQAPVLALDTQGRIAMALEEAPASREPQGIEPPAALLKASPAPREGLSLPDRFREAVEAWPWLKDPKVLAGIGGGVLSLALVLAFVHGYRKDQALKDEVLAARAAAEAPVAQQSQAPDLSESPASIRQEAEIALGTDPLRAYLRAEVLVSRSPGDAAAAQMLERARSGLAGGATGASLTEFQKHLQNGDLEAAAKVIDALLRTEPGDAGLRARAARLHLTLCFAHASQAKWDEAQEDLIRGRALFPSDKTWQVRLKLLDKVKAMPKAQQASWIPLLG
jgi:tetratricopeptide (TPR) repeat protein